MLNVKLNVFCKKKKKKTGTVVYKFKNPKFKKIFTLSKTKVLKTILCLCVLYQ